MDKATGERHPAVEKWMFVAADGVEMPLEVRIPHSADCNLMGHWLLGGLWPLCMMPAEEGVTIVSQTYTAWDVEADGCPSIPVCTFRREQAHSLP